MGGVNGFWMNVGNLNVVGGDLVENYFYQVNDKSGEKENKYYDY